MTETAGGATARKRHDIVFALFVVLLGLALHWAIAVRAGGVADTGRLPDTDAYTRTMRVERLFATGNWHDSDLPQLNAPAGLSVHWTRPLDVLILAPAMAAMQIGGVEARAAIFWTGAAVSPALHILCALAAAWAARALWPGRQAWFAALAVLANPALTFAYGAFGQTDHHMLVLLAAIIAMGAALRAILAPGAAGSAVVAGLALGLGIWVSPETLLIAFPLLAAFGCVWWLREGRAGRAAARHGMRVALAMLGAVALAAATERPPAQWLVGEYDKLSAQHVAIAVLAVFAFGVLGMVPARFGRAGRLAIGAVVAGAAAAVLLMVYPQALRSSEAAADAGTAALFLPYVAEMKPLRATLAGAQDLLLYAGGLVAVLVVPVLLRGGRWPAGLLVALVFVATGLATLMHRRFAVDLAAVTSIAGAGLVGLAVSRGPGAPMLLRGARAAAALLVLAGAPFTGLLFPGDDAAEVEARACDWGGFGTWLAQAPLAPDDGAAPIIMTDTWRSTPELAYRTPYRFVVSPYHRAGSAFQDTVDAMGATDDTVARAVLARRGVSYLLVCVGQRPANLGSRDANSLEARLRDRAWPDWVAPIALPAPLDATFRLARVRQ